MSIDLVNIGQTITRLNSQTSNQNVVESNILKLQQLTITITQERTKLQNEKTELRRLKKQIDEEKLDLQTQKTNMQNQKEMIRHKMLKQKSVQSLNTSQQLQQRKEHRQLQKKLAEVSKELTMAKRKLMSAQRKGNGDKDKRYKALERRYLAEKKNNRNMKRELDGCHSELTITRRKLLSSQRKGKSGGDGKKYKALLRKWMKQRKRLKLALMELDDRSNYYKRQINAFKKKQNKLLKQQKAMLKGKKGGIKYVFIDDVVSIRFHSKHKDRVKIVTKKGKTILVEKITVIHEKGKKKKGKKKNAKSNNFVDDDSTWMQRDEMVAQLLEEIDREEDNDFETSFFQTEAANYGISVDVDSDDESIEDFNVVRGDVIEWKEEMEKRNEDMKILMSIAQSTATNNAMGKSALNFEDLMLGIMERNEMRFEEIDDKELQRDFDGEERKKRADSGDSDEENDSGDRQRKGNQYDEGMKLLKTNCEEYVSKLKDTIANMKSIVQNTSEMNARASIIKRKSMLSMQSNQSSLLSPQVNTPLLTPFTPGMTPDWSSDQMTLFNPNTIADEMSSFYIQEMVERGKDIKMMHDIFYSVFSSDDKMTLVNLEEIMTGIDDRIDDIEDNEKLMINFIGNMQNWKLQFQEYAIRLAMLVRELSERRAEISQLFDVIDISGGGNKALINIINTMSSNIDGRHQNVEKYVNIARYEAVLGHENEAKLNENDESEINENNADIEEHTEKHNNYYDFISILENVSGFDNENEEWRRFIGKLKADADGSSDMKYKSSKMSGGNASNKIIETCVKRTMEEVTFRTDDIIQLKSVLDSKDTDTAGELLNKMEDRHNKLNESNNDMIKSHSNCTDYCISEENNNNFWKAIQEIVTKDTIMSKPKPKPKNKREEYKNSKRQSSEYQSSSLSLMMPHTLGTPKSPHTALQRLDTIKGIDYNENLKFVLSTGATTTNNESEMKSETNDEEMPILAEINDTNEWWLRLDEKRNKKIENFAVTTAQNNVLSQLAVFVSRILKFEPDESGLIALYIPIDLNGFPSAQFRCLMTFFDGVIISKLLCLINEDFIDLRGIHKPEKSSPKPISQHEINENVSVILSTLKSMGIILNKMYSIKDWQNGDKYCDLLISLLREIASRTMDRFCSYRRHSELVLLKKKSEPLSILRQFNGERWMVRWINYLLKRHGINNVDIDNAALIKSFNKDFMKILGLLNAKKRNSILGHSNSLNKKYENAKQFIKVAKTQFNVETPIEAKDFSSNNRFCQNYFAAQIFDKMNGLLLDKDSESELAKQQSKNALIGFDPGEKDSILAWINSFGLRSKIESLDDIGNGVTLLKVIDRLKKGAVHWNKVHLKVRHKYDQVINCNYVVDICQKSLGLRLVNTSGMDIVDKNTHILKSILWQVMRYQSVKILSDLQFGSNVQKVNNGEIVQWCNATVTHNGSVTPKCKVIKRLKDSSLTNGLYYLELIRAIMESAIDCELVNYGIPPLSSAVKKDFHLHDKYYKKRKENLKYAMTIIRRFGVDLFINVDDLFRLESRAVISILAALMTISLSKSVINNETKEESKNDLGLTVFEMDSPTVPSAEKSGKKAKKRKSKAKKANKSKAKKKKINIEPSTPLKMEHMDDIDIDCILDDVSQHYKK